MKICLISDSHLGIRNDNQIVLANSKKFFDDVLIPYLEANNIKEVIHLGDLVDRRKYLNYYTAKVTREIIESLLQRGIILRLILGNHDIFYRNKTDINIGSEIFRHYDNLPIQKYSGKFHYYEKPCELTFDGTQILFVPWICDSNREETTKLLESTSAKILFGHLELLGFEMYRGVPAHNGEDPSIYSKFDVVATGHYHHRSTAGNITYLGSTSQYIWSDYGDVRGFHVFDTRECSLDFIPNPYNLFEKVFYDDQTDQVKTTDFSRLKHKYVKVIVTNCNNSDLYDWFLGQLEAAQPIEHQIVNDHLNLDQIQDDTIVNETKSTLDIIRDYVASVNTTADSTKLDKLLIELYNDANSLE